MILMSSPSVRLSPRLLGHRAAVMQFEHYPKRHDPAVAPTATACQPANKRSPTVDEQRGRQIGAERLALGPRYQGDVNATFGRTVYGASLNDPALRL
jgi:hypothetical protein